MKRSILISAIVCLFLSGCGNSNRERTNNNEALSEDSVKSLKDSQPAFKSGYADVNGIKMYYEIYGEGKPIVLIHGGGSTIQSTFERIIPLLAKNRQVIGVELQAHGRTSDRGKPSSFDQDADDVAALLKTLNINKADFLGFSNGGQTTMKIAIRHPEITDRAIIVAAFYKRSGVPQQFWEGMKKGTIKDMPQVLKDAFLKVTPDTTKLRVMFERDSRRMKEFKDWDPAELKSIKAKSMVVAGDADVMTPEHAVEMHRLIPNSQLLIIPGAHGKLLGEISFPNSERNAEAFVLLVEEFLAQ